MVSALHETKVPVPGTITLCQDNNVLGVSFYVMEFVEGTPYRSRAELEAIGPRSTAAMDELFNSLLDLHAMVPEDVGLGDFGRPDGFWNVSSGGGRSSWTPPRRPDHRGTGLPDVHPRQPLTDLALLVAYAELGTLNAEVASNATMTPGYPGNDEMIARHAARSGRDVSALDWHLGFAFFKLTVILEGIFYRFSHGQTVGAGFDKIGETVALVARSIGTLKD